MKRNYFMTMMNLVDETYITDALPQKKYYYKNKKAASPPYKYGIYAAAAALCLCLLVFSSNGYAKEFISSAFKAIQNTLTMQGDYSSYATDINETVTDGDLSVTISEAYCDGINLFVSYTVKSKKGFSSYSDNYEEHFDMEYEKMDAIRCGEEVYQLDDFGVAGLEGKYTDEYTFAGLETYTLKGKPFPENFTLEISISRLIPETWSNKNPYLKNGVRGRWTFSIPISVNKADIQTIEVNVENNEHTIDRVVLSPIMATIYTSYPDIYFNTVNYGVVCFDVDSKEWLPEEGMYDHCTGFTKISLSNITTGFEIFVVNTTTLTKTGAERFSYGEVKKHAIVSHTIHLQ